MCSWHRHLFNNTDDCLGCRSQQVVDSNLEQRRLWALEQ